jgi:hypothetical protein
VPRRVEPLGVVAVVVGLVGRREGIVGALLALENKTRRKEKKRGV